VIEPDEADGGYVVTFPAIPDLATQGETLDEARRMAEESLSGYLEVLRETGRPMPAPGAATPSGRDTIFEVSDRHRGESGARDALLAFRLTLAPRVKYCHRSLPYL
jgi:predicted RNase H-like HicB family nuclease